MNKAELVEAISEQTKQTKREVNLTVSTLLDVIQEAIANGNKVTLVGFGTFESRDRQAREGYNPKTGEAMAIAAKKVPAFSAGKDFKKKVAA